MIQQIERTLNEFYGANKKVIKGMLTDTIFMNQNDIDE